MPSDVFFKCDDLYTANQAVYTASEFTISSFPLPQSPSLSSLVIKPRPLIVDLFCLLTGLYLLFILTKFH